MVKDSVPSPEKQLLKLIEEPNAAAGRAVSRKAPALSLAGLSAWTTVLRDPLGLLRRVWSGPLEIKRVNAALAFVALGMGIYFVFNAVTLAMRLSAVPTFSVSASAAAGALKTAAALQPLAYYLEKTSARDIFKIGPKEPEPAPAGETAAGPTPQENVLAKFKLVGISWSDNPDAMIEDSSSHKTYFLKRNQVVEGVRVQAIFKDKVILTYGGQEAELR